MSGGTGMSRWIWVVLLLAVAVYGWWRTAELRERGAHEEWS